MSQSNQQFKQFSCECGKQFSTRSEMAKHRESCATAQAGGATGSTQRSSGGQQTRGSGGSSMNE